MNIMKISDYCSGGDFGQPTGHLDSQIFPCKKDPSVESIKKRKTKKTKKAGAFNLGDYLEAAKEIEEPTIQSNPKLVSDQSALTQYWELREKYPELRLREILDIIEGKKLLPKEKKEFPSQERILPGNI